MYNACHLRARNVIAMHVLVRHEGERSVMVMYGSICRVREIYLMVIQLRLRLVMATYVRVFHVGDNHVGQVMQG
jgi:hypothetical protein